MSDYIFVATLSNWNTETYTRRVKIGVSIPNDILDTKTSLQMAYRKAVSLAITECGKKEFIKSVVLDFYPAKLS